MIGGSASSADMARDYPPHGAMGGGGADTVRQRSVRLGRSCHLAESVCGCSGSGVGFVDRRCAPAMYRAGTISILTHTMATTLIQYPLSLISTPCPPTTYARPVPPLPFAFTHPSFSLHLRRSCTIATRLYSHTTHDSGPGSAGTQRTRQPCRAPPPSAPDLAHTRRDLSTTIRRCGIGGQNTASANKQSTLHEL
jgi:hypothetical protein